MARGLKFRKYVIEGLYYPHSENKGADQLRGYREADLRLCFCICKKPVFPRRGSYVNKIYNLSNLFKLLEFMTIFADEGKLSVLILAT